LTNNNYTAPNVTLSLVISPASQTISFAAISDKTLGSQDFTLSATATSDLEVTFSSKTLPVCTVTGNLVHLVVLGSCTITASQSGRGNFSVATPVDQSFSITAPLPSTSPHFTSTPVPTATQCVSYTYRIAAVNQTIGFGLAPQNPTQLTFTANTKPAWLTLTDNGDGTSTLSGKPAAGDVGKNDVTLLVTDSYSQTDTQSLTITVVADEPPQFNTQPPTGLSRGANYDYRLQASDPDAGDRVTFSAVIKPDWLTLVDHGDGTATLSITPPMSVLSSIPVTIRVTDSKGAGVDQIFTLTIGPQFQVYLPICIR
jgi:hypothetical protein